MGVRKKLYEDIGWKQITLLVVLVVVTIILGLGPFFDITLGLDTASPEVEAVLTQFAKVSLGDTQVEPDGGYIPGEGNLQQSIQEAAGLCNRDIPQMIHDGYVNEAGNDFTGPFMVLAVNGGNRVCIKQGDTKTIGQADIRAVEASRDLGSTDNQQHVFAQVIGISDHQTVWDTIVGYGRDVLSFLVGTGWALVVTGLIDKVGRKPKSP